MKKKKRKKEIKYVKAQIKLKNFGFVRHSKKEELAHSTLGSLIYMEQAILKELNKAENYRDYVYDEKADIHIWGLGTKCYEMFIGRNGFNAERMKDLVNKVNKVDYLLPTSLSKEVVAFVSKNFNQLHKVDLLQIKNKVKGSNIKINCIKINL